MKLKDSNSRYETVVLVGLTILVITVVGLLLHAGSMPTAVA